LRCASRSKALTPTSSRLSPACWRRKARLTTSPAIAMPPRAFASGAARPSTRPTSKRSGRGSTGPGLRSRRPEPLPAGHGPAAFLIRLSKEAFMTKPRVLISDKMDPNAARIFEERGCDVDVKPRSEEHTSELQSRENLVCRLLLEKKKQKQEQ